MRSIVAIAIGMVASCGRSPKHAASSSTGSGSAITTDRTGRAKVNGVTLYYETHGAGTPVVLLHGGTSTIEHSFSKLLPELSKHYLIVGIEQVGHGHSPDQDRPRSEE